MEKQIETVALRAASPSARKRKAGSIDAQIEAARKLPPVKPRDERVGLTEVCLREAIAAHYGTIGIEQAALKAIKNLDELCLDARGAKGPVTLGEYRSLAMEVQRAIEPLRAALLLAEGQAAKSA